MRWTAWNEHVLYYFVMYIYALQCSRQLFIQLYGTLHGIFLWKFPFDFSPMFGVGLNPTLFTQTPFLSTENTRYTPYYFSVISFPPPFLKRALDTVSTLWRKWRRGEWIKSFCTWVTTNVHSLQHSEWWLRSPEIINFDQRLKIFLTLTVDLGWFDWTLYFEESSFKHHLLIVLASCCFSLHCCLGCHEALPCCIAIYGCLLGSCTRFGFLQTKTTGGVKRHACSSPKFLQ